MITKYTYGNPFDTEAIMTPIPATGGTPVHGSVSLDGGFTFSYTMAAHDVAGTAMSATAPTCRTMSKTCHPCTVRTTF